MLGHYENCVNLWEPADADPLVRWCERSGACHPLLLDYCIWGSKGVNRAFGNKIDVPEWPVRPLFFSARVTYQGIIGFKKPAVIVISPPMNNSQFVRFTRGISSAALAIFKFYSDS